MKLAFSTLGCPDWTLKYAVDQAKAMGFGAVEIRGVKENLHADAIEELSPANRPALLRYAKGNGVAFCCFGASAAFHEPEKREENLQEASAAVKLAAACGIPYVRVFGNRLVTQNEDREIRGIAGQLRILCERARPLGVEILLEVHGDFNTSERILKTAAGVQCNNFGVVWDILHSREDPARFWKEAGPLVRHVHIKDSAGGKLCSTGKGALNVANVVRILENGGYGGYYSLEWEKRWHPELRDPHLEFPWFIKFMNGIK